MNTYNIDDIPFEKIVSIPLRKDSNYKEQIECIFKEYDDLYHSSVFSKQYTYKITEEYTDTVIAKLDNSGDIIINKPKY